MGVVVGTGRKISCDVENISNHGALLRVNSPIDDLFQRGNIFCLQTVFLSPVAFKCEVVRVNSTRIAVQFID
jgi:hypothetical protein